MPARAGLDFSDYSISPGHHAWLLEDTTMYRLRQSFRWGVWLLAVAAVALLALSGCGGDSSTPAPSGGDTNVTATPTSAPSPTPVHINGWQTYSDNLYFFAIQYPPNWTEMLEPQPQGAPYEVVGFFPAGTTSNNMAPTQNVITITVGVNQPNTIDSPAPDGYMPDGTITVAGTSQTLLAGPGSNGGQGLLVQYAQDSQVYLFSSSADDASASA